MNPEWRISRAGLLVRGLLWGLLVGPGFAPGPSAWADHGSSPQSAPQPAEPGADRNADTTAIDPFGENVRKTVYLDQGWSPADSQRFYFTPQGSQILPYDWFLVLGQPESDQLFRDPKNILKFRYLPQRPDSMNSDGLPVGFAKDAGRDRTWLGFTCATCHTAEVHYKGVAYRIDGGPTLADTTGFLRSLADALRATRDQASKFDQFASKILADRDTPEARAKLKDQLTVIIDRRDAYNTRNFPPGNLAGHGRIDAFGAILNELFHKSLHAGDVTSVTENTQPANAPVSLPFLWDTPQHDIVQWNGAAKNSPPIIGPLGRNVGEVLGVFGDLEIPEQPTFLGYRSSVQVQNLLKLEDWLTTLWSPQWPADFPPIDATKRDQGKVSYDRLCLECHETIDRKDPRRRVEAKMSGTGTDPLMADNFLNRRGKAGKLEGGFSRFFPLIRDSHRIGAEAQGAEVLGNAVIGTIVGSGLAAPKDQLTAIELGHRPQGMRALETGPRYKGRPLNGIWATAPYLHNGSIPTLYDLLLPVGKRPTSFSVGNREFDPDKVGFKTDAKGFFEFRVVDESGKPIPGNSNAGHEFGAELSEAERQQLLEYIKSL
jgi:RoxA-like, cytochrome c-like